jgi:hypothetical protein
MAMLLGLPVGFGVAQQSSLQAPPVSPQTEQATPQTEQASPLPQGPSPLAPLQHGQLVVWVIHPAAVAKVKDASVPAYRVADPGYHEATPSSLGQTAGTFGQNAGSYGVDAGSPTISVPPSGQVTSASGGHQTLAPGYGEATPSSLGAPSSDSGTTAGSYGQTAGSLGTEASNHGQTAGSYGQTAGSFGNSLSTIADAGKPPVVKAPLTLKDSLDDALTEAYPGLKMELDDLGVDKLRAALKAVDGSKSYPDVLLYEGFPASWTGPAAEVRAMEVTSSGGYAPEAAAKPETKVSTQCLVLRRAPHPKAAGAFLEYLEEKGVLSAAPPPR